MDTSSSRNPPDAAVLDYLGRCGDAAIGLGPMGLDPMGLEPDDDANGGPAPDTRSRDEP